jgi:hypothetical protein
MGMQMTGSNGLLSVPSEHWPGLVALILFPLVAWLAIAAIRAGSSRGFKPAGALQRRIDATSFVGRVALLAMLVGAAVHAAIVPTHWGDSRPLAILFAVDTVGFLAASAWLLMGRRHWRLGAMAMLGGTVAGYAIYLLKGWETPDPVGLLTTGIELAAALVLVMPDRAQAGTSAGRRWPALASIPIAAVTLLGTAALTGAPDTSAAQAGAATSHPSMPVMDPAGKSTTSTTPSMPSMTNDPVTQPVPSMPDMNGSTGPSGTSAAMPPMTTSPAPGASTGSMPAMGNPGGSNGSAGSMPGMGGGSGGTALSLATTSPAGSIVWPLSMGAMGPGMQMVTPNCTATPTATQQSAAVALVDQTAAAARRYQSLANAKADGYIPVTPSGLPVVHYANPHYINDGNLLDPNAIESLVYANTPHGAVLVAAMYLMADNQIGAVPPMPGGCLTEWHVHTNLCFSDSTGTVVGVTSGGACKTGSTNHISQPMIHVWLAPVPGGPLTVDASNAQVAQAAGQLPTPNPPNPTA